jgi:hypothetical protein
MLTTLLCWRAMVQATNARHGRMRKGASNTLSELAAFARRRAGLADVSFQVGAPSAAQARLTAAFLRRHLRR